MAVALPRQALACSIYVPPEVKIAESWHAKLHHSVALVKINWVRPATKYFGNDKAWVAKAQVVRTLVGRIRSNSVGIVEVAQSTMCSHQFAMPRAGDYWVAYLGPHPIPSAYPLEIARDDPHLKGKL